MRYLRPHGPTCPYLPRSPALILALSSSFRCSSLGEKQLPPLGPHRRHSRQAVLQPICCLGPGCCKRCSAECNRAACSAASWRDCGYLAVGKSFWECLSQSFRGIPVLRMEKGSVAGCHRLVSTFYTGMWFLEPMLPQPKTHRHKNSTNEILQSSASQDHATMIGSAQALGASFIWRSMYLPKQVIRESTFHRTGPTKKFKTGGLPPMICFLLVVFLDIIRCCVGTYWAKRAAEQSPDRDETYLPFLLLNRQKQSYILGIGMPHTTNMFSVVDNLLFLL